MAVALPEQYVIVDMSQYGTRERDPTVHHVHVMRRIRIRIRTYVRAKCMAAHVHVHILSEAELLFLHTGTLLSVSGWLHSGALSSLLQLTLPASKHPNMVLEVYTSSIHHSSGQQVRLTYRVI